MRQAVDPITPRARLIAAASSLEPVHDEDVVVRIERLRSRHNASDQQIADVLGVHRNTVARWRMGMQPIDHPRMVGLALLLLEHQITRGYAAQ